MSAHSVSVNVLRIKAASHLVTLTHFDTDLGLLKRQQALGGVFIQASHAIAHASATKPVKEAMVFSQRRAMRRKRLI
jgi:hypothetical protein